MATLERTNTGGPTRRAWVQSRHAACVAELMARGVDFAVAWDVAVAIVAHWTRETGWGDHEHNFAIGNARAGAAWTGDVFYQQGDDDPVPAPYRAYATLAEAVRNAVGLLTARRYAKTLAALVRSVATGARTRVTYRGEFDVVGDPVAYYRDLMVAGWHPYSDASLDDYRGVLKTVAAWVGRPDPTGAVVFAGGVALALLALTRVLSARTGGTRIEA